MYEVITKDKKTGKIGTIPCRRFNFAFELCEYFKRHGYKAKLIYI